MSLLLCLLLLPLPAFAQQPQTAQQRIAIEAETLYTMGPAGTIRNGVVLVENGRITAVGPAAQVRVPAGYERLRARVVTPGLIDTKSSVGIAGHLNVEADQDADETTDPNTADARVLDAFNPREPLLAFVNSYGVTTVQVTPGPTNPIAGQAGIFKTYGATAEAMAVRPVSALVFNLGERPKSVYGGRNRAPATRMGVAALIRRALTEAQQYVTKWREWEATNPRDPARQPARDLRQEALARALRRELPVIFVAHREDDIMTALRLAQEFNLNLILSQATEGYLMREAIRRANVPVLVGPTLQRLDALETNNATLENAALLADAGISVAFTSGFEDYVPKARVLLFEAAIAMTNGLGFDRALRAATIDAARILGIADRVGSLERGKDADIVLFDGDPFEYTTHVEAVLVNGQVSYRRRQR